MESNASYVAVVCPKCHTRLHARAEHVGRTIACPDCGTKSVVRPPPPAPPKPKRRDPGEYRVSEQPADAARAREARMILVTCSLCGTRMHVQAKHAGRKVRCPDCGRINLVGQYREADRRLQAPDLVAGEYGVGQAEPKAAPAPAVFVQPSAIEAPEPIPEPPCWPLFSGIYGFPWRRGVVVRWFSLSLGFLVTGVVAWFALGTLIAEGPSRETVVAAGAFSVAVFFLGVWTFSFASACALVIVGETSEGADLIDEWPESDWREWFYKLLFMLAMFTYATLVAGGLRWLAIAAGADRLTTAIVVLAAVFISLPIWILSALESGSMLSPFSRPIAMSLLRLGWAWQLFYVQTGLMLAGIVATAWFCGRWPYAAVCLISPILAAYVLIYARLLGRLGWLIVDRLAVSAANDEDCEDKA